MCREALGLSRQMAEITGRFSAAVSRMINLIGTNDYEAFFAAAREVTFEHTGLRHTSLLLTCHRDEHDCDGWRLDRKDTRAKAA